MPPVPYRDELGQAHTRIERLEEELREERAKTAEIVSGLPSPAQQRVKPAALLAAIGFVVGGVFAFHAARQNPKAVLMLSVDSVMNNVDTYRGEHLKVEGEVVAGSTFVRASPCAAELEMERGGRKLPVIYAGCVLPDMYRDRSEIVVDGTLGDDGVFHARKLAVRVPSF